MKRLRNSVTHKVFGLLTLLGAVCFFTQSAQAGIGTSLMEGADVLNVGNYEARFQGDFIFNHGGGVNLSGHFRTGLIQNFFDLRAFVGTGKTDFQGGVMTKFNLLPDIPGQVGLSFAGGVSFIRDDIKKQKDTFFAVHGAVITSKNFVTTIGDLDPYLAFQVESVFLDGESIQPLTFVAGLEWKLMATSPFNVFTEFDFDVNDSLMMFAIGGAYNF